jgi:RHS repeat-associated protein
LEAQPSAKLSFAGPRRPEWNFGTRSLLNRIIAAYALAAFTCTSLFPGGYVPLAGAASPPPSAAPSTSAPWTPPAPVFSQEARVVAVPPVTPPVFNSRLANLPDEGELRNFRALDRPLLSAPGRDPSAADRTKTARMLERYVEKAYDRPSLRLAVLQEHLRSEPDSPYAASLLLEVSAVARQSGDFTVALEAGRQAWDRVGAGTAGRLPEAGTDETLEQAEQALGDLATLYAHLGQRQALAALLAAIQGRAPHPTSSAALARARAQLEGWQTQPELAAWCGIQAYNVLAAREGATLLHKPVGQGWGGLALADDPIEDARLTEFGLSAGQLAERVRAAGAEWRWIKRTAGEAIPYPAVMHMQFGREAGHYTAVVEGRGDSTRMVDRSLRLDDFLENSTLNRQASGYFMVRGDRALPEGFRAASEEELASVFGRDSCPNGNDDEGCNTDRKKCGGMAVASVSSFLPGLIVQDEPLSYRPAYGPAVDFMLEYRGVQLHGQNITGETSHFGPHWKHSLTSSYITAVNSATLPSGSTERAYANGTYFSYSRGAMGSYLRKYSERPGMTWLATGGYRMTAADGSYQDYTQPNGPSRTRYYLTKITDAQGLSLTLSYDASLRLAHVTDATGGISQFTYQGSDNKVRSMIDPFGRTATFTYDTFGRLQSITDALGIVSSFTYEAGAPERMATLTTPYGTTQIAYEGTPAVNNYAAGWAVTLTDPEGFTSRTERYYHDGLTPFSQGVNAEPRPPASIMAGGNAVPFLTNALFEDHFHVTLEWDKKQWYHYQVDKAVNPNVNAMDYAEYTLWLMSDLYTTGVPVATRRPGESARWYNYDGQPTGYSIGTSAQPSKVARQVEDENGNLIWVVTQQTYDTAGNPLIYTDERGRQTQLTYHPGTANVSSVRALSAPGAPILQSYTYNLRQPETITELSGRVTTYAYNAQRQVTSLSTSKGAQTEAVRGTYSTSRTAAVGAWPGTGRYLRKIERTDPANAAAWVTIEQMTYDSADRLLTHTDAGGYMRTFHYDNFDRQTLITHPDGTTEQFAYNRLDLEAVKDRAGRWTRTLHNPRRQPVAEIAADGRVTALEWCLCGSLQKLIDPLGRVTQWKWTIGGQKIEKLLPDGVSKTTYTYQPRSGRLATVTEPNEQGGGAPTVTYRYEADGRLKKEDYTAAGTPDVTYNYEPDSLGRLLSVVDGIGTHAYSYVPFTSGTAGAGQLEYLDGPLTHDRFQNVYDWQDRVATANLLEDAAPTNLRSETSTWDALGRLKTVANTLGTFTYGYSTALPRVDSLAGPNTVSTAFTYHPNNAPGDSARRLASLTHLRGGVPQAAHLYGYDKAGRITSWEQQSIGVATRSNAYQYNLHDELVQAEERELPANTLLDRETWGLDRGGNWLSRSRTAINFMETRTINTLNQLTQVGGAGETVIEGTVNEFATVQVTLANEAGATLLESEPAELRVDPATGGYRFRRAVPVSEGTNTVTLRATDTETPPQTTTQSWQFDVPPATRTFTYDANGNTLSDGLRTMTWDAKNRLKTVTKAGTTWKWDYDHADRRVREYTDDVLTKVFVWSGTELVQERDANNAITRTHYHGGFSDGPAPATGTKYQTLTDHLGNIREVLTASGTLAARYDYTPYQGPEKIGTSTVEPTFLTIGRYQHHPATGLELALYRAYDPGLGRWLSRDPIAEDGGINLYGYVLNNSVNLWDPLGLCDTETAFRRAAFEAGMTALGAGIGSFFGGGGGGLLGLAGGPVAPATVPAGAMGGSALGAAIGGGVGYGIGRALSPWLFSENHGQGSGNFEKGTKGDNTAQNRKANDACKKAGLNKDQMETFHDIPGKENMTFQELYNLAKDVKSGLY